MPPGIANCYAEVDVHFFGLAYGGFDHSVSVFKSESHLFTSKFFYQIFPAELLAGQDNITALLVGQAIDTGQVKRYFYANSGLIGEKAASIIMSAHIYLENTGSLVINF